MKTNEVIPQQPSLNQTSYSRPHSLHPPSLFLLFYLLFFLLFFLLLILPLMLSSSEILTLILSTASPVESPVVRLLGFFN